MIGGIVLAAGAATRMGEQKMLLPFGGMTVVERVVNELREGGVGEIVVVTGANADAVGKAAGSSVLKVRNPDYTRGMLSSVRVGLGAAPESWTGTMIALGDQPLIRREVVAELLREAEAIPDRIVLPSFDGRRGHPMVLPRVFWDEALTRHDDVGLRGVLRAHEAAVQVTPVDSADVLSDMDTPDDYRRALAAFEARGGESAAGL